MMRSSWMAKIRGVLRSGFAMGLFLSCMCAICQRWAVREKMLNLLWSSKVRQRWIRSSSNVLASTTVCTSQHTHSIPSAHLHNKILARLTIWETSTNSHLRPYLSYRRINVAKLVYKACWGSQLETQSYQSRKCKTKVSRMILSMTLWKRIIVITQISELWVLTSRLLPRTLNYQTSIVLFIVVSTPLYHSHGQMPLRHLILTMIHQTKSV